jgi:hypothetical protein
MSNPYQPPIDAGGPGAAPGRDIDVLVRIATHQREINLSLAAYFGAVALLREDSGAVLAVIRAVVLLGIFVYSLVATVRLANALHGTVGAIGFGIMVCVPVLNLIALLILSMGASRRLRDAGITVGFLGADPKAVAAMKNAPPR